ncbi:hypothetical protein GGD45_006377 [Rhizobium tropici]|uniref:Uncharacterized protein n=1 Tax=Rhizobium tropici TaxID=398 RepID=A0ABR6R9N7_RHITR|nr:hypothetical protein [Rhizobium tropici]
MNIAAAGNATGRRIRLITIECYVSVRSNSQLIKPA